MTLCCRNRAWRARWPEILREGHGGASTSSHLGVGGQKGPLESLLAKLPFFALAKSTRDGSYGLCPKLGAAVNENVEFGFLVGTNPELAWVTTAATFQLLSHSKLKRNIE